VRRYRSADAAACCLVINRAVEEMDGLNDAARLFIPTRNIPDVLNAELVGYYTVVCEVEEVCVGVGALDDAEVKRMYVDPSFHRCGVGDDIMSALESEAARRGLEHMRLDASLGSSLAFYQARGYIAGVEESLTVGDAVFRFVPITLDLRTRAS
jgi:GNAT superfamily N-acetyltransferase